jgi:putative tricarboxylic transport membrane protein
MSGERRTGVNITVLIEGAVLLFVGAYIFVDGIRLMGLKGVGQMDVFGPGRYSLMLGFLLIILGPAYVVLYCRERLVKKYESRMQIVKTIFVLCLYLFLVNFIGYLLASMVFFLLMFRVSGFKSWPIILSLSVGISILFHLLFVSLLGMMFPSGLLFR